jgi:hypothetical protein
MAPPAPCEPQAAKMTALTDAKIAAIQMRRNRKLLPNIVPPERNARKPDRQQRQSSADACLGFLHRRSLPMTRRD